MRRYSWPQFCFLPFVILSLSALLTDLPKAEVVQIERGETKRSTKAMPGNCAFCHKAKSQIPTGHPETKEMNLDQCKECHNQQVTTLANKLPLSHFHLLAGVSCEDCHDAIESVQPTDTQVCLQCHGTFHDIVASTNDMDPNPHNSHIGTELDCRLCHHLHKKSENFCKRCHEYKWNIP